MTWTLEKRTAFLKAAGIDPEGHGEAPGATKAAQGTTDPENWPEALKRLCRAAVERVA